MDRIRRRFAHYADTFLAAFAIALVVNADHVLDAHGLDALKSAGVAALITAAKAGIEAVRATIRTGK